MGIFDLFNPVNQWNWITDGIDTVTDGISDIWEDWTGQTASDDNIKFQQNENAITRQREDNAVQRRALDLEKAGMNPVLAAGGGATAVAQKAPESTYRPKTPELVMQMMKMKKDMATAGSQKKLLDAQANKTIAEKNILEGKSEFEIGITETQWKRDKIELEERLRNIGIAKDAGMRSDVNNSLSSLIQIIGTAIKAMSNKTNETSITWQEALENWANDPDNPVNKKNMEKLGVGTGDQARLKEATGKNRERIIREIKDFYTTSKGSNW